MFAEVRRNFPLTDQNKGITYLNSASTGPLCRPVREALERYYDAAQFLVSEHDTAAFADLEKIRKLGAKFIGADSDEIGFGFHTGFGLNIAAFGLPLKQGDEILLSDIEFPSNVYPWLALRERGIDIRFIESSDHFFDIDKFERAIGSKSRVLSLSFVQFFNGYKNDLKKIGEICRKHGLYFVVDGIQGCGHQILDIHECQVDIFSTGAQKWLLSPLGTGYFYVRRELQNNLQMPFASWLSVDWKLNFGDLFHYDLPYFDSARKFEMGTYPYAHVHAMAAALELIDNLGVENIQKHNHSLLDILIDYLKSSNTYTVVSSLDKNHRSSILSFTSSRAGDLFQELKSRKVICSFRQGAIRIAVHLFNDESDIRRLLDVLEIFEN